MVGDALSNFNQKKKRSLVRHPKNINKYIENSKMSIFETWSWTINYQRNKIDKINK